MSREYSERSERVIIVAVKWTKQTRSKNLIKEKMRKKISDKTHFKPVIHGRDMKKIITAKTKRWK